MKRFVVVSALSLSLSMMMPLLGFSMRSGESHGHIGNFAGHEISQPEKHTQPFQSEEHASPKHVEQRSHEAFTHDHPHASIAEQYATQDVADDANQSGSQDDTEGSDIMEDLNQENLDFVAHNEELEHISLDNLDIDGGGNWLEKRIWYERAQNLFDEIQYQVKKVVDLQLQFSNEVNAIGHKIDLFYENIDFNKGQLDEKFKDILAQLDQEQKLKGDLSVAEKNLQTSIKQEQLSIEQVGKDIKAIGDVDNKIDQTLVLAFKTIDECRDYEGKAWKSFKNIGKELDDKKARALFYEMNNFKQNIDQKFTYLKSTLLPYLHNTLVAKIETNIARISSTMAQLKDKGVDLQAIMSKTQQDSLQILKEREKEAVAVAVEKALEQEREQEALLAKKNAQALEKAKKESYVYVMHQYYQATVGPIVSVVSLIYLFVADSVGHVYTYATSSISNFMKHTVSSIMSYFQPEVKKIKAEIVQEVKALEKQRDQAAPEIAK